MPFFFYLSRLICHSVTKAPSILLHFVAFLIYHALLRFSMQRQKVLHFSHIVPSFSCNLPINFFRLAFFSDFAVPAWLQGFSRRFSARKTHLKKKVKKQLTKAFLHDRINKSSGEGHKKVNMGVFPSGQWGQTVNLLLSASVVRIHPRPPNKKNPNLFPIGEGFGFFVFFGFENEGSRGRRKTPIPCHRP